MEDSDDEEDLKESGISSQLEDHDKEGINSSFKDSLLEKKQV